MTKQTKETTYQVILLDGRTIDGLSHEVATQYFYSHAGSKIRPWPVQEYKAP